MTSFLKHLAILPLILLSMPTICLADDVEKEIAKLHLSPSEAKTWIEARNFLIQYFQIPADAEIENFSYRFSDHLSHISWSTRSTNGHLMGHERKYDFDKKIATNLFDGDLTALGVD